jgi:hypothetical protein
VFVNGIGGNEETLRNLAVGEAQFDVIEDFELAPG